MASWEETFESEDFALGRDLGESLGKYDMYLQVKKAYEMGEIELWLSYHMPKSLEDWAKWEEEHGKNFDKRWEESNGD